MSGRVLCRRDPDPAEPRDPGWTWGGQYHCVYGSLTLLTDLLSFSSSRNKTSCWGRGCQAQVMLESLLPAALLGWGQS